MAAKFGTSGLRGLATELVGQPTISHVQAFCAHLLSSGKITKGDAVYVGHDFRASSAELVGNVFAAITAQGLEPRNAGPVPTPALALKAMGEGAASIMVTGSHIPADRNGVKFYRPDGEIDKTDEQEISRLAPLMKTVDAAPAAADHSHFAGTIALFKKRYEHFLPAHALQSMTIAVYEHSTVARDLLGEILEFYGAKVLRLGRSEAFIPVDTEAVSDNTKALISGWARSHAFDALVSADGDGDRPLVADETGEILRGDLLGVITAGALAATVIATPVTSNSSIEDLSTAQVVRSRVGSPYVIAAMNEAVAAGQKAVVGFEANGGFLTASTFGALAPLPTRDCFLPILAVLHQAVLSKCPVSALREKFPMKAAVSDRLENYPPEKSRGLVDTLTHSEAERTRFMAPFGKVIAVTMLDGLRMALEDGTIIHLRPSGNAPEFRVYVEAITQESAEKTMAVALSAIK